MEPRARVSVWPDVAAYPVLLPPTLGEHVEQNVSLATSSDARLRRPVRVTVLRRAMSVPRGIGVRGIGVRGIGVRPI